MSTDNSNMAAAEEQPHPIETGISGDRKNPSAVPEDKLASSDSKSTKPAKGQAEKPVGTTSSSDSTGGKNLSGAEKKALQKAEKAARRAQAKATAGPQQNDQKGGKKSKGGGPGDQVAQLAIIGGPLKQRTSLHEPVKPKAPECFAHLPMARRIAISQADRDIHPSILALGQQMAAFALTDPIGRLQGTLLALKKVLEDYTTPQGSSFSRHFTPHTLNPQIDYLSACRPMSFSMGNAVRWLKTEIVKLDMDVDDLEAKKILQQLIDEFIREKITLSDQVILELAQKHIQTGDVIITYRNHRLVESLLRQARLEHGKDFEVIVVDDPVEKDGQALAETLARDGIKIIYYPSLGGIQFMLERANKVLLGAEGMFQNGSLYALAGTADIALYAADYKLPVIALCHSISFTERVAMDSLTYNEVDPDRHTDTSFRLLFDATREKYVTAAITDQGSAAARSAAGVIRRWQDPDM